MPFQKKEAKQMISGLSQHLFWDVDRLKVDANKHQKWLLQRVLEYGLFADWLLVYRFYGIKAIAESATQMADLDPKAMTFVASLSGTPLENFICYTSKLSKPQHWNF